jgi:hypothetical protein
MSSEVVGRLAHIREIQADRPQEVFRPHPSPLLTLTLKAGWLEYLNKWMNE